MTSKATNHWEPWMGVAIALRRDGMKQAELAAKTGLSESDISRIVNGKRRIYAEELIEIAAVQGRDWSWYLEGPEAAKTNRAMGLLLKAEQRDLLRTTSESKPQPVPQVLLA